MDALQCILTRRSCRSYEDRPIPKKEILELLTVGTKAATGSGMQPWGFVTLEGREKIAALSDEIKAWLKENFADFPWLAQYREWLDNPNYNIFYDADNVICVYGDTASHWYVYDGTLCTANIMLAAHAKGIGSCWIGFAQDFMDRPEITMSEPVEEAMTGLRKFMFKNVYLNPKAKGEEDKAVHMIEQLYEYYVRHTELLPKQYLDALTNPDNSREQIVCDYIAGMTDPYAVKKFQEFFVPESWKI